MKQGGLDYIRDLVSVMRQHRVHWQLWNFWFFYDEFMIQKNLIPKRVEVFLEELQYGKESS